MGKIMTVNGEINTNELGVTSMHEHLMCDTSSALGPVLALYGTKIPEEAKKLVTTNLAALRSGMSAFSKECITLDDVEFTIGELNFFKMMGGNSIVDASPRGMPHTIKVLQEASEKSGVNIVGCTGL